MDRVSGGTYGDHQINILRACIRLDIDHIDSQIIDDKRLITVMEAYQNFSINYKLNIIQGCILNEDDQLTEELKVLLTYKPNDDEQRKFEMTLDKCEERIRTGAHKIIDKKSPKTVKIIKTINDSSIKNLFYLATQLVYLENEMNTNDILDILEYIDRKDNIKKHFQNIIEVKCHNFENIDTVSLLIKLIKSIKLNERENIVMMIKIFRDKLVNIQNPEEVYAFYLDVLGDPKKREVKQNGEVYTPLWLVDEMLDKLPSFIWTNKNLTFFEPAAGLSPFILKCYYRLMEGLKEEIEDEEQRRRHIIENMLFINEIQQKNVDIIKKIYQGDKYRLNIYEGDFLMLDTNYKFSVILGNPPYTNDKTNISGQGGKNLWIHFCRKSLDILIPNGFLLFIHPPLWRKPYINQTDNSIFYRQMLDKNILYIRTFNKSYVKKIMNVSTRVDYYLLQNCPYNNKTLFIDINNNDYTINLSDFPYIPNGYLTIFQKIFNKLKYHQGIKALKTTRSEKSQQLYPFIQNVTNSSFNVNEEYKKHVYQHHPKILFSDTEFPKFIFDDGLYGLTSNICCILTNNENMLKYLQSKLISFIIKYSKYSTFRTDWEIFHFIPDVDHLYNQENFLENHLYQYFQLSEEEINIIENKNKSDNEKLSIDNIEIKSTDDIEINDMTKFILNINKVKDLKELLRQYNIPRISKLRKDNMDQYKQLLIDVIK